MAGTNRYELAKKLLSNCGYQKISLGTLRLKIGAHLATTESAITGYIRMMIDMGLIKEIEQGTFEVLPNGKL